MPTSCTPSSAFSSDPSTPVDVVTPVSNHFSDTPSVNEPGLSHSPSLDPSHEPIPSTSPPADERTDVFTLGRIIEVDEWFAEFDRSRAATPILILDYDGEEITDLEREEPTEQGDYDRVSHEESALLAAREALYVYTYNDTCVVTSNSRHAPAEEPPVCRDRPALTLENMHLPHWLDHYRPHLAFMPLQRTFRGLLRNVYWNRDPSKMLERPERFTFRTTEVFRAKNVDALGDLYRHLTYAARTLEPHVYPPSMRNKIRLIGPDPPSMKRWYKGMPLAMHYGRQALIRVLEAIGLLSMMIALSRVQTGSRDKWRRILETGHLFRLYPSMIDSIASSIIADQSTPRVGGWIDAQSSSAALRFHLLALEEFRCPVFVQWPGRPLDAAGTWLHITSGLVRFICSDARLKNAKHFPPPPRPGQVKTVISRQRLVKSADATLESYFSDRVWGAREIFETCTEEEREFYVRNYTLARAAVSPGHYRGGYVAGVDAYQWRRDPTTGYQCDQVNRADIPALFQQFAENSRCFDVIYNCWEFGDIFADPRQVNPATNSYNFTIGSRVEWWESLSDFVIGHPRFAIDVKEELDQEITFEQQNEWEANLPVTEAVDNTIMGISSSHYAHLLEQTRHIGNLLEPLDVYFGYQCGFFAIEIEETELASEWTPALARCKLLSMVVSIIGTPIQSTKLDDEASESKSIEDRRDRERRELQLSVSQAQQIIDFMGQMIMLGKWMRAEPRPTLQQLEQYLLQQGPTIPSPERWSIHPANWGALQDGMCPGLDKYDIVPAVQLAHPTDPQNNWHEEPVWLLRHKYEKNPVDWWIGIYDPVLVRRLVGNPENGQSTMRGLLVLLLELGARVCTPVSPAAKAVTPGAYSRAADLRLQRQEVVLPIRESDHVFTARDFNAFYDGIPTILEQDHGLMRACAMAGGWTGHLVSPFYSDEVLCEGPTKQCRSAPLGKVFRDCDGLTLLDDGAEYQQINLVLGTFAIPQKKQKASHWPRRSFMPPDSATKKICVLPLWSDSDTRRVVRERDAYCLPDSEFAHPPLSIEEWKKHFNKSLDRGRADYALACRSVCRLYLDKLLGPPPFSAS